MQLSDYGLSRERGFLSQYEIDEIALPSMFDEVKQAACDLSDLLTSGRVRHWLEQLADPGLEGWAREAAEEEVRTAMVHYSFLVQAYVWGEPEPPKQVSGCIVTPFCVVGCGSPRCHKPLVAVFAPGVLIQPRADSKLSSNNADCPPIWSVAV